MPKQQTDASRKWRENIRIALIVGILVLLGIGAIVRSNIRDYGPSNMGLGSDMDCKNLGYGEPVCVKKR
jgi:ABC-type phosphate/phosphonate transport system permease subunit